MDQIQVEHYPVGLCWQTVNYTCTIVSVSLKTGPLARENRPTITHTWASHLVEGISKKHSIRNYRKEYSFKKLQKELKRANIEIPPNPPTYFDSGLFVV
jgi:hypothetical protein